jgi:hypothetical protein
VGVKDEKEETSGVCDQVQLSLQHTRTSSAIY